MSAAEPPPPRPDVDDRLLGPGSVEAADDVTWSWWEAPVVYLVAMLIAAVPILIAAVVSGSDASAVDSGPTYILALVATELAFFGTVLFWVAIVHRTRLSILWPPKEPLRDLAVGIPRALGCTSSGSLSASSQIRCTSGSPVTARRPRTRSRPA